MAMSVTSLILQSYRYYYRLPAVHSTYMGDRRCAGKPSRYVTSHFASTQPSIPSWQVLPVCLAGCVSDGR